MDRVGRSAGPGEVVAVVVVGLVEEARDATDGMR